MKPGDTCRIWMNNRPLGHKVSEYVDAVVLDTFTMHDHRFVLHNEYYIFALNQGQGFLINIKRFQVSEVSTGARITMVCNSAKEALTEAKENLRINGRSGLRRFLKDTRKKQKEKAVAEAIWRLEK